MEVDVAKIQEIDGGSVTAQSDAVVDADATDELGDQIATLAAHLHAATHRLLVMVAEYDRRRGWERSGQRSCAHWLAFRTGIDLGTAREKVRAARALEELPLTSEAMSRGELSFSQVRALTRAADRENEGELLELARGTTTATLERVVRAWKKGTRKDEAAWERERHAARTFSVFPDDDGMYVLRGRLTPEVGAVLMRAIEAAGDALFRERRLPGGGAGRGGGNGGREREATRARADAVGLVAERALAAGFGLPPGESASGAADRGPAVEDEAGETGQAAPESEPRGRAEAPDGEVDAARHGADARKSDGAPAGGREPRRARKAQISGTRADRFQVVLHVEPETLRADAEAGRSELEDGTRVSPETSRRLSCDAGVVPVKRGAGARILNVGRKTRTIPPALRRALEVRDRGCRFPGCGLRFTDVHHVRHWADGGETSLENCLLLCRYHHRLVHEGEWRIRWWGRGRPVFVDSRGGEHFDGGWHPPRVKERPVAALLRETRRWGVRPHAWTASARWKREDDIPESIYFPAREAVDST